MENKQEEMMQKQIEEQRLLINALDASNQLNEFRLKTVMQVNEDLKKELQETCEELQSLKEENEKSVRRMTEAKK